MSVPLLRRIAALNLLFDKWKIAAALVSGMLAAILTMALPPLFGMAINELLSGAKFQRLTILAGVMLFAALLSSAASLGANKLAIRLGYQASLQLSVKIYESLLRMPYLTYSTINQGVLSSRLINDIRMIEPLFVDVPLVAVRGWTTLIAAAVALMAIDPWYLIAFLVIPISLPVVRYAEATIDTTIAASFECAARTSSLIEQSTSADAIVLLRQSGRTQAEGMAYAETAVAASLIATKLDFWRASVRVAYDGSFAVVSIAIISFGAISQNSGRGSVGGIVSALLYLGLIRAPLSELIGLRYPILRAKRGLQRIEEVLNSPNTGLSTIAKAGVMTAPSKPRTVSASNVVLAFEQVSYRYPTSEEVGVHGLSYVGSATGSVGFAASVHLTSLSAEAHNNPVERKPPWSLSDISFSISKGEIVAVAGVSGAGKSTVVGLACGLLRPTSGRIVLNGRDTADLTEEDIWNKVAIVSQDVYLRDGTLKDNLIYGLPHITEREVVEACHLAGLTSTLRSLTEGLNTQVGARGKRFSGGERQRLSIARALLKDSDLLVLDEATASLDTAREADILASINILRQKGAILIVTHRLATVSVSDRVIMIEGGRIVERGTHRELLRRRGSYAAMHREADG